MPLLSRDIKRDETERELVLSRRETNLSAKLRHEMRPGESISGEVKVAKFNMLMRERELDSCSLLRWFFVAVVARVAIGSAFVVTGSSELGHLFIRPSSLECELYSSCDLFEGAGASARANEQACKPTGSREPLFVFTSLPSCLTRRLALLHCPNYMQTSSTSQTGGARLQV